MTDLMSSPNTMPASASVVRVRNVGSVPFSSGFANNTYTIAVGAETIIPYDAAVLWLGDPNSRDLDGTRRNRLAEYTRLRTKYGAYADETSWDKNKPKLEVYDLDGNRLYTVVDDPEGLESSPAPAQSTPTLVQEQMDRMAKELELLRGLLMQKLAGGDGNAETGKGEVNEVPAPPQGEVLSAPATTSQSPSPSSAAQSAPSAPTPATISQDSPTKIPTGPTGAGTGA